MKKILFLLALLLATVTAHALPFVTTPSTSTYPIHWYQLKINDKYVYYDPNGGVYNQVDCNTINRGQFPVVLCESVVG